MNKRNLIRHFFLASLIATSGLFADYSNTPQMPAQQQANEIDLFNKDEPVVFASAEFLWWTVQENATDYAIKMTKVPAVEGHQDLIFPQGKYQTGQFDWDPGYRLTLGYFNAPKFWEIYGQYSWIYVSGRDSANKPENEDLLLNETLDTILISSDPGGGDLDWVAKIGIYQNDLDQVEFAQASDRFHKTRATSHIGFLYHLADLIVNRVFIPNPHLRLRLLGGLTGTYIKQNWRVRYLYFSDDIERIRNKWDFTGIGFRLGLTVDWFMGADFYLTGRWSTALLVGRYHNDYSDKVLTHPELARDTHFEDWRPAFTGQFLVGPSWQKNLENARIELFAGYELTPWFNLQENYRRVVNYDSIDGISLFPSFVITHNRSLILLHGLTARLTVDF